LKVSTDYSSGDPTLATLDRYQCKFPSQASNIWSLSDNINLSAFKQTNVHFAFVYISTLMMEPGGQWMNVSIINSPTPPPPA